MGNKFSPVVASNSTAGDRLLYVGQDAVQLSTGDLVMLVTDPSQANPSKVSLVVVTGHTAPSTIAILPAWTTTGNASTFLINHALPQCLALCRDASDNLYVFGANGHAGGTLMSYQGFVKMPGLVWQPSVANVCLVPISSTIPPVGFVALWCNTGGGLRYPAITGPPAGHVIVAATTNDGTITSACYILNAGGILAGVPQYGTVVTNPLFLGTAPTLYGSNLDISADGFGASRGLAVSANGTTLAAIGSWGVTSTGALTTGSLQSGGFSTGTLTATTKLRIARVSAGQFAVVWPSAVNAGQLTVQNFGAGATGGAVDTGTSGGFPAPSASLSWDIAVDAEGTLWIYGWNSGTSTTMMRLPITFPGGVATVGSVITDDTSVGGTNTTIRTVKEPVDWFHADWQSYAHVSSTYSLVGDYSSLPVVPDPPTLLTPANNAAVPYAAGGSFTWGFGSPDASDAQATYYLRFQTAAGYQWWTGSALTVAQAGATGGSEVAVTSGVSSATLGAGILSTGPWSWSVQVTGASGLVSGYSPAWIINVATPPATPTLTASYDPTNNRAVLTVSGTGTDDAWFEYSDDGTHWFNVFGATAVPQVAGSAVAYDWWIPANATRSYRVAQFDPTSLVVGNYSAWSSTQTATSTVKAFWLRDAQSMSAGINPHVLFGTLDTSFGENLTEHAIPGRSDTVIVADVIGLEDGGCTFFTETAADDNALMALLKSQRTLLLQSPDGRSWFIRVNVPRPVTMPYLVQTDGHREHPVTWRGQQPPPA